LISVEAFGAGFGNAAFTVFIMRTTKASYKAAHFAIGTGLMNIAGTMAGVVSGFLAAAVGFPLYFGLTFLLTLPNMALIPLLPNLLDSEDQSA
jgi:PAT family beta-lactamase induction signal transducer AmpG